MGNKVTFDYSKVSGFVKDTEVESMKKIVAAAKEELVSRNGACLLYTSDRCFIKYSGSSLFYSNSIK